MEDEEMKEISFEEAGKFDDLESKYFSPSLNIPYKLTFSGWSLYRKNVPKYNDKTQTEERTILQLLVDSRDGQPCKQEYNVLSIKVRAAFQPYCKDNTITKKVFNLTLKGKTKTDSVQVTPGEDRANPPVSPTNKNDEGVKKLDIDTENENGQVEAYM